MAFIQEAPFDLQTSDLPAPSANQRILYPVDDGSTTGKQWRARDDSEVLIVMLKHNYSATTAPGTGDDVDDGYSVGSIWVDTTNGNAYICEDNSTGAAVWLQINGGGGSSLPVDDTTSLVQDPSTNSKQMRIDVGNVADSTVRVLTMPDADVELFKDNLAASSAPTTGNDNTEGYAVGSYWIDTTNDKAYVCLDASTGAAVWTETTQSGGGSSLPVDDTTSLVQDPSTNSKQMRIDVGNVADSTVRVLTMPDADVELFKDNLAASSAPTTSNDNTEGYAVGSYWIDTTNDKAYVCLDASTGAAVWTETTQSGGGSSLPVDDTTSLVQDPSTNSKQMRIDVGNVADSTVRVLTMPDADVELVKNNLAASSAPTTGDDSDDGYAVSSVWIDTTNDKAYVCLDASVGAAVWNEIGEIPQILHQHFNTGDTGLNDIASAGYVEFDSAITIEITTTGGDVYATFTGLFVQTAGSGGFAKIALYDGSVIDSDNDADASAAEMEVGGASAMAQTLHATFTGLPAGTYYVRLYGKTASGTVRLNNTTTGCSMMAREY